MKYAVEISSCGMIYVPTIMKISAGVQTTLRFCLRNLRCCNIGINDGRDF
jgi:uncharacterized protein YraI